MKKMNNRGFMLMETLIVATFLVTTLLFIYVQFNNITKTYNDSFKYNTVNGLYLTKNIAKYIYNDGIDKLKEEISKDGVTFVDITDCSKSYFTEVNYCNILMDSSNVKTVLFTNENLTPIKNNNTILDQTIVDFINYVDYDEIMGYRLIIEFNDNTFSSLRI